MRIIKALLLFLILIPAIAMLNYRVYFTEIEFAGLATLKPSTSNGVSYLSFHSPTESLAELTCNGGEGKIQVIEIFDSNVIVNRTFIGSISQEFIVPREGTYWVVYYGKGTTTCFIRFKRNDPTVGIQNAFYSIGIVGAALFLLYTWRERK